jgi:hypothetical protein
MVRKQQENQERLTTSLFRCVDVLWIFQSAKPTYTINQVRQRAATVAKDRIITFAKGPLGMRVVKDDDGNW